MNAGPIVGTVGGIMVQAVIVMWNYLGAATATQREETVNVIGCATNKIVVPTLGIEFERMNVGEIIIAAIHVEVVGGWNTGDFVVGPVVEVAWRGGMGMVTVVALDCHAWSETRETVMVGDLVTKDVDMIGGKMAEVAATTAMAGVILQGKLLSLLPAVAEVAVAFCRIGRKHAAKAVNAGKWRSCAKRLPQQSLILQDVLQRLDRPKRDLRNCVQ